MHVIAFFMCEQEHLLFVIVIVLQCQLTPCTLSCQHFLLYLDRVLCTDLLLSRANLLIKIYWFFGFSGEMHGVTIIDFIIYYVLILHFQSSDSAIALKPWLLQTDSVVAGVKNDGTFWWPGINSCKPLEGTEHWSGICVFWAPCVCILPWGLVGSLVILENLNRCLNYIILQQIFVWSKKKNPSKFIREFPLLKRKQKNAVIVYSHWYPHPPGNLELCLVF